jgi:hypothetical protein
MVESTLDSILNFLIPPVIFMFIAYIFYRIPLVKEGIDRLREWWSNRGTTKQDSEAVTLKSITYE